MPIPVIVDCDPGTDDALAILLALASPELTVLAITVAGGNVGLAHTLRNACALAALAGSKTPVYAGADRPLLGAFASAITIHGENGLGGIYVPDGAPPAAGVAADVIRQILRTAPEPVALVGVGPATNLALALITEPSIAANVAQIVLMSGAWAEGNVTPAAEFNAWSDPESLADLLQCGRPVVFATLELTAQALVTPAPLRCLARPRQRPMPQDGLRYSGHGSPIPPSRGLTVARPLRRCLANPSRPLHHPPLLHQHRPRTRPEPRPHLD